MANRFWVGNSGSWTGTTHWSATSGGANGASAPTSSDNVFFDSASFTLASQIVSGSGDCLNIDFTGVTNTPSFQHDVNVYSSLIHASGVGTARVAFYFFAGAGAMTITTNGNSLYADIELDSPTGSLTFQDDYTTPIINDTNDVGIFLDAGILNANDKDITIGYIYAGAADGDITINMGSGTWTLQGEAVFGNLPWHIDNDGYSDDVIVNAGTSHLVFEYIRFISDSGMKNEIGHDLAFYDVTIRGNALNNADGYSYDFTFDFGAEFFQTELSFNSLTFDTFDGSTGVFVDPQSGHTYSFGTLTANGTTDGYIGFFSSTGEEFGDYAIFSIEAYNLTYITVQNNHAAGGAIPINALPLNDLGGNLNWGPPDLNITDQVVFFVASNSSGDIQAINVGKSDDEDPIYYELETQELEFGDRSHLKKISDKLTVITQDGLDSQFEARQDDGDFKSIPMSFEDPASIGKDINLEGHFFTFRWFGQVDQSTPVLEEIYIEDMEDLGVTNG